MPVEDLTLLPKRVYWFKKGSGEEQAVRPVNAEQFGGAYKLNFTGASLAFIDGHLFAPLLPEPEQPVEIKLQ
ncbi:hypothetical protein FZEAL_8972 [Fusarium zealandicum]|uniref:Uncharacterized protein n=1 Tax=Fusarium zealandicum TaxID=1053134 RepID=A0A8H4XGZ6_9HYPO|nr:hypothetical protein FZEAL_8972 [Fusarium zealandicum]